MFKAREPTGTLRTWDPYHIPDGIDVLNVVVSCTNKVDFLLHTTSTDHKYTLDAQVAYLKSGEYIPPSPATCITLGSSRGTAEVSEARCNGYFMGQSSAHFHFHFVMILCAMECHQLWR